MISCDFSKVEVVEEGRKIYLSGKTAGALRLFLGQTLFGSYEEGSRQLFLSTIRLNPEVNYFRVYLENVRESLARTTGLFKEHNINILSGGALSFGNIWISEIIADFRDSKVSPDDVRQEIDSLGGFVLHREITELFPRSFALKSTIEIRGDENDQRGMYLLIPHQFAEKIGLSWESTSYAVLKTWSRVQALFIDFYPPGARLVGVSAKILDVPGSLFELSNFLKSHIELHAIDESHYDELSGEWVGFGILVIGELEEVQAKAERLSKVLSVIIKPLGWR
ncbi:MAG: hypothetical protein ACE5Z5_05025 [Candidatus Bathyarchaeia archaeon]